MKGKGLKYFFILTDAGINEETGGRTLKPLSGKYDDTGGLVGIAYNLERVASRRDTRFAFFYYTRLDLVDASMEDDLRFKGKTYTHLLNWSQKIARAKRDYCLKDLATTGYLHDIEFLEYALEEKIIFSSEFKFFKEKIEGISLIQALEQEIIEMPDARTILDKYVEFLDTHSYKRAYGDRLKHFAEYKINQLVYDYWQNCFIMSSDQAYRAATTRLIFKRLSKIKFFIPD